MKCIFTTCLLVWMLTLCLKTEAQADKLNPIVTSFPSLRIPPSSRGLSMGDAGVASAIGNDALYYNAARTAFTKNFHQIGIGFTPWLAAVSNDTRFIYVNYLANTGENSALGFALNYLRTGNLQIRDNNGATISESVTSEFSLLTSFAIQVGEHTSLGTGLRFLAFRGAMMPDGSGFASPAKSIVSLSGDVSFCHIMSLGSNENVLEIGAVLSNIGPKISVTGSGWKNFLPVNLGIGVSYKKSLGDEDGRITFALDANKLLVPSPPETDVNGNILRGKNPDRSVLNALFSSFSDAPIGGKEEFREIRWNAGVELDYRRSIAFRGGVSLEHNTKGNRKFIGLGAGYRFVIDDQACTMDFHYLVPFGTRSAISPFTNSWGFTLQFDIGNFD